MDEGLYHKSVSEVNHCTRYFDACSHDPNLFLCIVVNCSRCLCSYVTLRSGCWQTRTYLDHVKHQAYTIDQCIADSVATERVHCASTPAIARLAYQTSRHHAYTWDMLKCSWQGGGGLALGHGQKLVHTMGVKRQPQSATDLGLSKSRESN